MQRSLFSVVVGIALLGTSGAEAQVYLGGNAGWAKTSIECDEPGYVVVGCNRTSTGYKGYVGYRFANHFAIEGVYFDWGKATVSLTPDYQPPTEEDESRRQQPLDVSLGQVFTGEFKSTVFGLGVAYFLPIATSWTGVARVGVAQSRVKLNSSGNGLSASVSNNSTQAYFGIGIGYNVMPNLAITAEADFSRVKWRAANDYDVSDNVQLLSFGLRYAF